MDQKSQQDLMLRFSRCAYVHGESSYEKADCAGAARVILRDFGGFDLPDNRLDWAMHFEILPWPSELRDFDVLLLQHSNQLGLVDHMAVHIGNGWIAQLGKDVLGLMCERLNRYQSKILHVARFKHQ